MKSFTKTTLSAILLTLTATSFAAWPTGKIIAGYLDTTSTGSAQTVDLNQAQKDGYNVVVFAFAYVNGSTIGWGKNLSPTPSTLTAKQISDANTAGMGTLISVGGEGKFNTFHPGTDYQTLATNIVNFLHTNKLDGIDFDIETANSITESGLTQLLSDIKTLDSSIIITGAPQLVDGTLTPSYPVVNTYRGAAMAGLFNALFVQEYNTGTVETAPTFISSMFDKIAGQMSSSTKVIIGEPTAASAAGADTIFHPTPEKTLSTTQVTALMRPELQKILSKPQFGGVMGWSLNADYDRDAFPHNSAVPHVSGAYAYGLKDCVINGQCSTTPPPKFSANLQVTDTDSGPNALGFTAHFYLATPTVSTGYLGPNATKTYQPSDAIIAGIQGKDSVQVEWQTYSGGPTGTCPAVNFSSSNVNLQSNNMVNEFIKVNANVKPIQVTCETKYYHEAGVTAGLYGLKVNNTGPTGIEAGFVTSAFNSDWINPGESNSKTYTPALLEGKKGITVHWSAYKGGPTGICSGSFDLTKSMHIMVNPTTKACAFMALPTTTK